MITHDPFVSRTGASGGTSSLRWTERFWTWAEAMEVATRANAQGRVTVKRDGDRWAVTYRPRLILMNAG